jgi:fructose-bisphosphate aldolase class I
MSELNKITLKILSNGKGILAADESTGTMTKRLEAVNVPSSLENRLLFRETLFSSEGMRNYIGGVILYDETIKQISNSNKTIPDLISSSGAVPGIKVDTGAKVLAGSLEEKITEGLDGLRERLKEYYKLGARFTKWRGVFNISNKYPSKLSIHSNAHALARYSALVQE